MQSEQINPLSTNMFCKVLLQEFLYLLDAGLLLPLAFL